MMYMESQVDAATHNRVVDSQVFMEGYGHNVGCGGSDFRQVAAGYCQGDPIVFRHVSSK